MVHFLESSRSVQRAAEAGSALRVSPGSYVDAASWAQAERWQRFEAACRSVGRSRPLSGRAAAAVWGYPLGRTPEAIEVAVGSPSQAGRFTSKNHLCTLHRRVHRDPLEVVDGIRATSRVESLLSCLLLEPLEYGLIPLDAALREELLSGEPQTLLPALRDLLSRGHWGKGRGRARQALELGSVLSESPGESLSRGQMHLLGVAPARLQQEVRLPSGRSARLDFYWPEASLAGEFDGASKYGALIQPGQSVEQVIREERQREKEVVRMGIRMVRWGWREASDRDLFRRILTQAGVPWR